MYEISQFGAQRAALVCLLAAPVYYCLHLLEPVFSLARPPSASPAGELWAPPY